MLNACSKRFPVIMFCLAALAHGADSKGAAGNGEASLDELLDLMNTPVISASKLSEEQRSAPATIYVIREEDIIRNGYLELKDALESVPGLTTIDCGFFLFGGQRGFNGNFSQTLLLVNGREMQMLFGSETFISHQFATHNIKQIEIIQGPGSAMYGANALVGVINIITKDQSRGFEGTEASVDIGSNDTRAYSVVFAKQYGDWRFSGSLRNFNTDSYDYTQFINDPTRFSEGFPEERRPHLDANNGYRNRASAQPISLRLDYRGFYVGREAYTLRTMDGIETVALDFMTKPDNRELELTYGGWQGSINPSTDLTAEIAHYKERMWLADSTFSQSIFDQLRQEDPQHVVPGQPIPDQYLYRFTQYYGQENSDGSKRDKVSVQIMHRFQGSDSLVAGWVWDRMDMLGVGPPPGWPTTDPGFPFDMTRSDSNPLRRPQYLTFKRSIYAQYKAGFLDDDLLLTAGARLDRLSFYGNVWTIRSGLVWKYSSTGTLKALFGQAFREPNIFERGAYDPSQPYDTSLKPAKMNTYEVGFNQVLSANLLGNITFYRNLATDYILPPMGTVFVFRNLPQTIGVSGTEAQLRFHVERFQADLGFAYTDAGDATVTFADKDPQGNVARTWSSGPIANLNIYRGQASLGLNYDISDDLRLNSRITYWSPINALHGAYGMFNVGNQIIHIPGATRVNFTASSKKMHVGGMEMTYMLTISNAFDKEIYEPSIRQEGPKQYMRPGREWCGRVMFRF